MTFRDFSEVFAMLALQLRATDVDETTARAYFEALKDLEIEFIQAAAVRLSKVSDGEAVWFPKTAEWRAAAFKVRKDREDAQTAAIRKSLEPWCAVCDDSTWRPVDRGVVPCECRIVRYEELLGRRHFPATSGAMPLQLDAGDPDLMAKIRAAVKSMPKPNDGVDYKSRASGESQ